MRGDMKVTMAIWIVSVMLIAIASAAQAEAAIYFPLPINGIVSGINVKNLEIRATNLRTGSTTSTFTNSGGSYLMEATDFSEMGGTTSKYGTGDTIRVEILACAEEHPDLCVKEMTYTGQFELFMEFDLYDVVLPCPAQKTCGTCGTGGEVICPSVGDLDCPADPTPYLNCDSCCPADADCDICFEPDCPVDPDCEECENPDNLLLLLLGSLGTGALVVVAWITKIKISRVGDDDFSKKLAEMMKDRTGFRAWEQDGKVLIKHLHRGVKGYHSPDVVHRDPADRHDKGQLIV